MCGQEELRILFQEVALSFASAFFPHKKEQTSDLFKGNKRLFTDRRPHCSTSVFQREINTCWDLCKSSVRSGCCWLSVSPELVQNIRATEENGLLEGARN